MNTNKVTFYVGLNDKETLQQKISTADATEIVANIFSGYADGCTIFNCTGFYRNKEGIDTVENTLKVEVFDMKESSIGLACEVLKLMLNQESICVQKEIVNSEFY